MDISAVHRTLRAGEMLNWYRIERVLGRGGFGVIYLATDTNLDHPVAIKEYIPAGLARRDGDTEVQPLTEEHGGLYQSGLERFIKEARNLVRFKHPNIVRVMSVFQQNNTAYMVMEFEEGENLCRYLERDGNCSEARLRALIKPICLGLGLVHRHGFIHRDVKPANILVRPDGSPVLLDFGSARHATQAVAGAGLTALVTAGYAPLEQYDEGNDEQQGPWTDIYALGGVLYFAISGDDPVDGARRASAVLNGGRDPLIPARTLGRGRYSPSFLAGIDWALAFRIADRPQTLADWLPGLLGGTLANTPARRVGDERRAGDERSTGRSRSRPAPASARVVARDGAGTGGGTGAAGGVRHTGVRVGVSTGNVPERDGVPSGHPEKVRTDTDADLPLASRIADRLGNWFEEGPEHRLGHWLGARTSGARRLHRSRLSRRFADFVVAGSVVAGGVGVAWFATQRDPPPFVDAPAVPMEAQGRKDGEGDIAARRTGETAATKASAEATAVEEASEEDAARIAARDAARDATRSAAEVAAEAEDAAANRATAERSAAARREAAAAAETEREASRERTRAEQRRRAADAADQAARRGRLVAEAKARAEASASRAYSDALAGATASIDAREFAAARSAIDAARATGLADARLSMLSTRLAQAVEETRRPVTDAEFDRVLRRFDGLKRAIETKDRAVIDALTEQSDQSTLFARLMRDFAKLNMEITGIRVRNADKSVTANLRIRDMRRDNGDSAVPSDAFRDREITSKLVDGEWSRIAW